MTWNLFIDDERFPPSDGREWKIARNINEVYALIVEFGFPSFVSFDHDLGDDTPTGYDISWDLINDILDGNIKSFPEDFRFYVHSQNPIGKANIEKLWTNFLNHR